MDLLSKIILFHRKKSGLSRIKLANRRKKNKLDKTLLVEYFANKRLGLLILLFLIQQTIYLTKVQDILELLQYLTLVISIKISYYFL